ncbi:MAG: hypothetical protein Q9220_000367 [cf. Caloplaca sp. 1 TL-2023]
MATPRKASIEQLFPNQDSIGGVRCLAFTPEAPENMVQSSPGYFEELVRGCTQTDALAVGFGNPFLGAKLPLLDYDVEGSPQLPSITMPFLSEHNAALCAFILSHLTRTHLQWQLQYETNLILERRTTSEEQIERVRNLLRSYEKQIEAYDPSSRYGYYPQACEYMRQVLGSRLKHPLTGSEGQINTSKTRLEDEEDQLGALGQPEVEKKGPFAKAFKEIVDRVTKKERRATKESDTEQVDTAAQGEGVFNSTARWGMDERVARVARRRGMKNRLTAAIVGGLSVIGPMLIMAIHPSQVKTLVTASAAVILFAVGLAWKSSAQVEALLGTTAAYAAVLVVFVGVNSN